MRSEIAHELELQGDMHRFIAVLARERGARCLEMEVHHRARTAGETKYGLGRTFRVILDVVTVKYLVQFAAKPMRLFGRLAIACFLVAILSALGAMGMVTHGASALGFTIGDMTISALVASFAGLQLLATGAVAEQVSRFYFQPWGRRPYTIAEVIATSDENAERSSKTLRRAA